MVLATLYLGTGELEQELVTACSISQCSPGRLQPSSIHLLTHSSIHPFIHPFIHSFTHLPSTQIYVSLLRSPTTMTNNTTTTMQVSGLQERMSDCPSLKVDVVMDRMRGTRGEHSNSTTLLLPLKQQHNASIFLFHSPNFRGLVAGASMHQTHSHSAFSLLFLFLQPSPPPHTPPFHYSILTTPITPHPPSSTQPFQPSAASAL